MIAYHFLPYRYYNVKYPKDKYFYIVTYTVFLLGKIRTVIFKMKMEGRKKGEGYVNSWKLKLLMFQNHFV
jgi:hypothetical protein